MREAMHDLRYRWLGLRIGGPDATMSGQWIAVSVSMIVVFGCFFAIGRFHRSGGAAPGAAPSAQAGSSSSAVPTRLSGGSPTAGAVPVAISVKPEARLPVSPATTAEVVHTVASKAAPGAEASSGAVPTSESQSTGFTTPQSTTPAPTEASPGSKHGRSTSKRRRATRGGSTASGAVTFDSSE